MQSLRSPKWVFLINTAPLLVLLLLCYGEFSVIHTLLPTASVVQWQLYGAVLALLGVGAAGYAGRQLARRQPLEGWYSVAMLLSYSLWLCLLTTRSHNLLPWGAVPRWMIPTDPTLMAWTFLMPTLAHSLLALVAKFTPDDRPQNVPANIAFAVVTPPIWGALFSLLGALPWPQEWGGFTAVPFAVGIALSTLSFFFFLVRALFIIVQRRSGFWGDTRLVWKIVITTALPLLGLGVNNGLFLGSWGMGGGVFGDFSSSWFYLLAVLTGVLLCLPDSDLPLPRLLQLLARSAVFGYTLYFFLIFLPFLPLSIPAVLLLGLGFLLMAPTLLFVVHLRQLNEDLAVVRVLYSKTVAVAVLLAGLAVLPLSLTATFWHYRRVLHEALAYTYTPNYARPGQVDAPALARTLATIRQNQGQGRGSLFGSSLPYLSSYFNWLVLDNLMLSESRLNNLERIFVGQGAPPRDFPAPAPNRNFGGEAPYLRDVQVRSRYDARQQAWVSWVKLEVANYDTTARNREYHTSIALPPGCWVSDYYLTIGNRQERGILAEKRAADWVFAQIENENRDPGLLSYAGPNTIDLRVFPVSQGAARRTSIQFLHKEPCSLSIDGRTIALGDSTAAAPLARPVSTPSEGVFYVSALAKKTLPLVQRRPYYHFLLDVSAKATQPRASYQERIARQLAQPLPNGAPPRFSLVNAYTTPIEAGSRWEQPLERAFLYGGFYVAGAIRQALFEAQEHPTATYPVLVAVTDDPENMVLDADFERFSSAYPESDAFYVLGPDGRLSAHSLRRQSRYVWGAAPAPGVARPVRAWPTTALPRAYLPDTDTAAIVLGRPQAVPTAENAPGSRWLSGLMLAGYDQWQTFHPETTERERVPFVQASFRTGILTPFTAFLALENEAQKAALHRKQEETMAANTSLDAQENPNEQQAVTETPLDSGALLLLAAGLLLAGWYLRRPGPVAAP